MLQTIQQDAIHLAAKALDLFDVTESSEIAQFIKKVTFYSSILIILGLRSCERPNLTSCYVMVFLINAGF